MSPMSPYCLRKFLLFSIDNDHFIEGRLHKGQAENPVSDLKIRLSSLLEQIFPPVFVHQALQRVSSDAYEQAMLQNL